MDQHHVGDFEHLDLTIPAPTTDESKQRSRCNAVRYGLTADTAIGALEDADDYKAFEAAVIAD